MSASTHVATAVTADDGREQGDDQRRAQHRDDAECTLPMIELFHSLQGEGTRVGEPATFIRLAGCNLRCSWCDTPYSWNAEGMREARATTLHELVAQVRERAVVLTGGEPLLHRRSLPALVRLLREHGVEHVTVETNATIFPEGFGEAVDLWSLSPKLPGSGEQFDQRVVRRFLHELRERVQLKFVIASLPDDWRALWEELERCGVPDGLPVIVQPDGLRPDYGVALRELSELVMADDARFGGVPRRSRVRVVPQTHRIAWGARARSV